MSFSIYLLQAVAFLDLSAVSLIVPLVPSRLRKIGGNEIQVGLLGSIYAGSQLLSGPLFGSLSDLKGRKPIMALTLLVCSVAYSLLGFTNSIFVILVIRAILGVFKQTQMLTKALVPDYERNREQQAVIYGKMAAISGVGMTLGPLVGGHIAEDHPENGFSCITMIVGFIFALNACIVYFLPNVRRPAEHAPGARPVKGYVFVTLYKSVNQSFVELWRIKWHKYWDIFMFKALVAFAMGVYYSNYVMYLKTQYNLSPKYIGYVISFQGIIGSISSFFIGFINRFYIHDKDYCIRNLHVFILLTVAIAGLILSFNVYFYCFWLIPLSVGNAIGRLVTLEMLLKRGDRDHAGSLIGASNSVRSLAGVVAPMVAGLIREYIGVSHVVYASLCSTFIGLILSCRHRRKLKRE